MDSIRKFNFPKGTGNIVAEKTNRPIHVVQRVMRGEVFHADVINELANVAENIKQAQTRAEKVFG